jgi:hypothetical protein
MPAEPPVVPPPDSPPASEAPHDGRGSPPWNLAPELLDGAPSPPPTPLAVAAFVTGLLGVTCLPGSGGLVAIILGLLARGEIRESRGRRSGAALANAGLVLGTVSIVAALGLVVLWTTQLMQAASRGSARRVAVATRPYVPPGAPTPPPMSALPGPLGGAPSPRVEAEPPRDRRATVTVHVGAVLLTDLGTDVPSLARGLDEQRQLAARERRDLLLWTNAHDCAPCDGVAAALLDERLQNVLAHTLLVRVDVADFAAELDHFGVPVETIPGFARLGADNRPVDFVHGGEWDADLAINIAPVLRSFVRGDYVRRRHPWHPTDQPPPTPI